MSPPPPPSTSLAPGFRFKPTDEELVMYYLNRKASGQPFRFPAVREIDVYKFEPWELAGCSLLKTRDQEWYFFTPVRKNRCSSRRATENGYWKSEGQVRRVRHKSKTVGKKKTLVYYSGRVPDGKRTNWFMHEFRLSDNKLLHVGVALDSFVLCRVFLRSGSGQPNGDYNAPFVEEEWTDDAAPMVPVSEPEYDLAIGETRPEGIHIVQEASVDEPETSPFVCELETSEDCGCGLNCEPGLKTLALFHNKRLKPSDPNSNGSQDSIATTSQDPRRDLMKLQLFEPVEAKECDPQATRSCFDAATLEKFVPPGYLKLISDLENEICKVSTEKENLKTEVMRARLVIDVLQSRIEVLSKGKGGFRPVG